MWESRLPLARFPRGSWEAWETCFWFSTLSTAPPFPQLSSLRIWLDRQLTRRLFQSPPLGFPPVVSSWPPPLDRVAVIPDHRFRCSATPDGPLLGDLVDILAAHD